VLLADAQRNLRFVASTNEQTEWMELMQLQADEGPCVECFHTGAPVSIADLANINDPAGRWPRFFAALQDRGAFRSVHALPLRLRGEAIGTLNIFDRKPGPLPAADLALGQALADVDTIGMSERAVRRGEVVNEQLQTALNNRVVIEQAKGVLAEHGGLSMDAAFDRLRRYSRNRRLTDVVREVVDAALADDVLAAPTGQAPTRLHRC